VKFRKRPIIVEAERYNGSYTHHEMCEGICRWDRDNCPTAPHVHTAHEGQAVIVEKGDWIIREPGGRGYYPCKPDIFEATYEPVQEAAT
jgi:hypothetical protein